MSERGGPGPCQFVIFGATGNLAKIKLLPALYHLHAAGRLNEDLQFVAVGRRPWDDGQWRETLVEAVTAHGGPDVLPAQLESFAARFEYLRGDLQDDKTYSDLFEVISRPRMGTCENVVFYLSIRPEDFLTVVRGLDGAGLNKGLSRHRIVVEKPFGSDLESARQLNRELHAHFDEDQVYRIDHYLGKETVQNLMVFRLANTLIEPLWNRNYIDHVQITAAETLGIGTRGGYFDTAGSLRDMVQNHLMQLLAVTAMEPPATLSADDRRDEKVKVLRSMRAIPADDVANHAVRGQYTAGTLGGEAVPGYLDEPGIAPASRTETYVAARFFIDNWRWRDVPFYVRTGKRLAEGFTLVAIRFRHPPQQLFHSTPLADLPSNWVTLSLQPEECMQVHLFAKQPGLGLDARPVILNTRFRGEGERRRDAYEMLLLDVIEGDNGQFIRFDEVEEAWRVVAPVLDAWGEDRVPLATYAAGSWGPAEADALVSANPAHRWRNQAT